jgi:poly-gamma-glutamate capsule biosynthesis protein CapA/YwtB (metallophosphatase superfamily)
MRRARGTRLLAFAAALAVAAVIALARESTLEAQEPPPPLSVRSALPDWRAPSGRLAVRGKAGPGEAVRIFVGKRAVDAVLAGPSGGFLLVGRVPGTPGRYPVAVEVARDPVERLPVGSLRVRALRLAAVGDVNLGDRIGLAIGAYGSRYPWSRVAAALKRADIAVANLECAVSRRGSPLSKQYTFRGAPSSLRAAAFFAGIDVLTLANNHSLDFGRLAFADTLRFAHDYGMKTIGGGANLTVARRPAVIRAGGLKVALLGFSDVRPLGFDAGQSTSGTTPAFPEIVAADVRAAARRADVVVAYFHWGIERTFVPSARQRSLAAVAFDAGATVVLGTHPHVLQPIATPRPRQLVAWSLGNFVFGATSPATSRTGILNIRLGAQGALRQALRRAVIGGTYGVRPELVG